MSEKIFLFRRRNREFKADRFRKLCAHLELEGELVKTDEALAVRNEARAMVYAQPCANFAGQLFYIDQTIAWGEVIEKPLNEKQANEWSQRFLDEFELRPNMEKSENHNLEFELTSFPTEGLVFDGQERRKVTTATNIRSQIQLNGIPVVGPRGKVRMLFKDRRQPVMMQVGLWESLEVYEERDLVSENEVARAVQDKLADRNRCGERTYNLNDVRLVYFADEYHGGPDLLAPEYLVEVEYRDPRYSGREPIQGPRQVIRLPAYR